MLIAYKEYAVTMDKNIHEGGAELYGCMDSKTETITLDADLSHEQKCATLLHECIHAMDDVYAIGLSEEQVVKLGTGLYLMLRDNPELYGDGSGEILE
jgi:transketolase C-terminal domain/subunit